MGEGEREKRRRGVWIYRNSDLAVDARNSARSIGFQKRKSFRLRDWRADLSQAEGGLHACPYPIVFTPYCGISKYDLYPFRANAKSETANRSGKGDIHLGRRKKNTYNSVKIEILLKAFKPCNELHPIGTKGMGTTPLRSPLRTTSRRSRETALEIRRPRA